MSTSTCLLTGSFGVVGSEDVPCKANSRPVLEVFSLVESITTRAQIHTYVDEARRGDCICHYTDLRKIRSHYPGWNIIRPLGETAREIVQTWNARIPA
jgi:CDP-paratose 2-epimerase